MIERRREVVDAVSISVKVDQAEQDESLSQEKGDEATRAQMLERGRQKSELIKPR
jgi:hypothetical protein